MPPSKRRRRTSSSTAAVIEGNDDLLLEILLYLPAKSIIKFKTVNKRWRSLTSDPLFCLRHTLHHPLRRRQTQTLLLGSGGGSVFYRLCNPTIPKIYPTQTRSGLPYLSALVLQSCNGLLLLNKKGELKSFEKCRYHVLNPTTMQETELPPPPYKLKRFAGLFLLFDPNVSQHYDVVCFSNKTKKGNQVYLYKSETREWKLVVGEGLEMGVSCNRRGGFYFNGGICFPRPRSSCLFTPDGSLTKIPNIPQHRRPGRQRNCVLASNGALWSLTLYWNKEGSNVLIVCEMKEEEMRWRKRYELDMNPIMAKCGGGDCGGVYFEGLVRAEEEEDSVLVFRWRCKVKIYRFRDGGVEDFDRCSWIGRHHFIETLAPV